MLETETAVRSYFGKAKREKAKNNPRNLIRELESVLKKSRKDWSLDELRSLWPTLNSGMTRKCRSLSHETSWLSLSGYVLRPGYGHPQDRERMDQIWRLYELGLSFQNETSAQIQEWILWRRVAGGLSPERQSILFKRGVAQLSKPNFPSGDIYRALTSFELLEVDKKVQLGERLVKLILKGKAGEALIWSLGRVANRLTMDVNRAQVIDPELVYDWFIRLSDLDWRSGENSHLRNAFKLATRVSFDEKSNLSNNQRSEVYQKLISSGLKPTNLKALKEYISLEQSDQVLLLGDSIPTGLRLEDMADYG